MGSEILLPDTKLKQIYQLGFTTGCPAKSISNFEGQYEAFSLRKNHQIYTNITPQWL